VEDQGHGRRTTNRVSALPLSYRFLCPVSRRRLAASLHIEPYQSALGGRERGRLAPTRRCFGTSGRLAAERAAASRAMRGRATSQFPSPPPPPPSPLARDVGQILRGAGGGGTTITRAQEELHGAASARDGAPKESRGQLRGMATVGDGGRR
jgi:hypothetical protein